LKGHPFFTYLFDAVVEEDVKVVQEVQIKYLSASPLTWDVVKNTSLKTGRKYFTTSVTASRIKSIIPDPSLVQVPDSEPLRVWNKILEADSKTIVRQNIGSNIISYTVEASNPGERWTTTVDLSEKMFSCNCPFFSKSIIEGDPKICKHIIKAMVLSAERISPEWHTAFSKCANRDEALLVTYYYLKSIALSQKWRIGVREWS
jgi:hypothetical protein